MDQVLEDMLHAVVPEEHPVVPGDLLGPLHYQLDDVLEVPKVKGYVSVD